MPLLPYLLNGTDDGRRILRSAARSHPLRPDGEFYPQKETNEKKPSAIASSMGIVCRWKSDGILPAGIALWIGNVALLGLSTWVFRKVMRP